MRDVRTERVARSEIREERLRSTSGVRHTSSMTSWRGLSGRRYVVGIQALDAGEAAELTDAVVIAVRRGGDGIASVVDVAAPSPASTRRARLRWLALARTRGATEMHVHLLAESEAERQAVLDDLAASSLIGDRAPLGGQGSDALEEAGPLGG